MAKIKRRRLTNRMKDGCAYVQSETGEEGVGHFTTQRRLPELITFVCKTEDIMDKYGINDLEDLDSALRNKIESIKDPFLQGYIKALEDNIDTEKYKNERKKLFTRMSGIDGTMLEILDKYFKE